MGASSIVSDWRANVRDLLPALHGHQANALAGLSLALALAGDCRRFERTLANHRLRPRVAPRERGRALLLPGAGRTILRIADPRRDPAGQRPPGDVRPGGPRRAGAPAGRRGVPAPPPPGRMPHLVRGLPRPVRGCLPHPCRVVLLADRGLAWPTRVDCCAERGRHDVLRLLGQTVIRFPDGPSGRPARSGRPGGAGPGWWRPGSGG